MKDLTLDKVKNAKRESKYLDFKEKFDINQAQEWCEIIKDIVAMANSGGGCILIGAGNNGTPSGWDATPVLNLDPAQITDKIARYTGEQYADFEIQEVEKNGHQISKEDVKRVMEIAADDKDTMIELAKEMKELTPHERKRLADVGKIKPKAKVKELVEEAKKPRIEEKMIVPLTPALLKALDGAVKEIGLSREEIAKKALDSIWEIQISDNHIAKYQIIEKLQHDIVDGKISLDMQARQIKPSQTEKESDMPKWQPVSQSLAKSSFSLTVLFQPIWAHTVSGAAIGAKIGIILAFILAVYDTI